MTVAELISKLEEIDNSLPVLAAGESADRVIVEHGPDGNAYVRIFEGIDTEFVLSPAMMAEMNRQYAHNLVCEKKENKNDKNDL